MSKEVVNEILRLHGVDSDTLISAVFLEVDRNGKAIDSVIVGITNSLIIMIRGRRRSQPLTFDYHILSLRSVRLDVCCAHYKKLSVLTSYNEMFHFVLVTCKNLNVWQQWVVRVLWQVRQTIGNPLENDYGVRGIHRLKSKIHDPFLDKEIQRNVYDNADMYPFSDDFFRNQGKPGVQMRLSEESLRKFPSQEDSYDPMARVLGKGWRIQKKDKDNGKDLPESPRQEQPALDKIPDSVLYYDRDVVDGAIVTKTTNKPMILISGILKRIKHKK